MRHLSEERLILLRAADIMEERGHCKGYLQDDRRRVCLRGAILAAAEYSIDKFRPADKLVHKYLGYEPSGSVSWNNAPERTKEEVVAALRGAALHGL